jgi:sugar lactone lactonase YvrE
MRSFIALAALAAMLPVSACNKATSPANEPSASLASPELVVRFDPSAGELPEGLALTKDAAYVGFAPTSRVVRVDAATGAVSTFGQLPAPVSGKGFMTGLALAKGGDLYAGLASFVPEVQAGIYRIAKTGGAAALFAKDDALAFPNALAFDDQGALFATDSGSGSVFRIDESGRASRWYSGAELTGDQDACDKAGPGFPIGANGLVVEEDAIYVVNLDQATLVKIPREASGAAGTPQILAGPDCATLGGADGLARAHDGSFLVAVNRQDKIVRIDEAGGTRTLVSGAPLDFPATLAYRGSSLFATNFALVNASAGKAATPGLIKLDERP